MAVENPTVTQTMPVKTAQSKGTQDPANYDFKEYDLNEYDSKDLESVDTYQYGAYDGHDAYEKKTDISPEESEFGVPAVTDFTESAVSKIVHVSTSSTSLTESEE